MHCIGIDEIHGPGLLEVAESLELRGVNDFERHLWEAERSVDAARRKTDFVNNAHSIYFFLVYGQRCRI